MNKAFTICYFLFCCFFLSFFSAGVVDSQDGLQYLAIARRIYFDRTFEMPEGVYPESNIHMSNSVASDGKIYSPTGLGFSLSLIPAVMLEDLFLRLTGNQPLSNFPLYSDWPVLLFASMTNAFWGAVFTSTLFLYLRSFGIELKKSALLGLVLVVTSNIFPYTKHVFAHMMFLACMLGCFYLIRRFSLTKRRINLVLAGVSLGLLIIAYNPFFLLTLPAMGIYYLLLMPQRLKLGQVKQFGLDLLSAGLAALPFFMLYRWFNSVRFGMGSATGYGDGGIPLPKIPPLYVMFDGGWNVLFSAGKSIFLFTPALILLILFWHKLSWKKLKPEIVAFSLQFLIFYYFVATLLGDVDYLLWHGDSSWGPRYMLPILPGALVLVGVLINQLSQKTQLFVVTPILLLGLWIQLIGVLLPYQIRFQGLQTDTQFNGRNFNVYEYGNIIPRYSPVLTHSKTLPKKLYNWKNLFDRGKYQLVLKDGFDRPFKPNPDQAWREILPLAVMEFEDDEQELEKIKLLIRNHQVDPTSSYSAILNFNLNNQPLASSAAIGIDQEAWIELDVKNQTSIDKNLLTITPHFEGTSSARLAKQQIVFLKELQFNNQSQNLFLMDYPYVSPISEDLLNIEYQYYGGVERDPWTIWHMHSAVFEETFDLWWLRPFHYWDLPKRFFICLFVVQVLGVTSTILLLRKLGDKSD